MSWETLNKITSYVTLIRPTMVHLTMGYLTIIPCGILLINIYLLIPLILFVTGWSDHGILLINVYLLIPLLLFVTGWSDHGICRTC